MLRNYLLIAVRNLTKNMGYTAINVIGLAVGLACCLLVTLYIRFEVSYDDFHKNGAHLYRYIPRGERDGQVRMQTFLPAGFGPLVKENFSEVRLYSRFGGVADRPLIRVEDKFLPAKPFAMADKDFFKMFTFPLAQGTVETVLTKPSSIAISKSIADNYFPQGDAVGKIIRFDNTFDLEVTGVFEDVPVNSHFEFSYITSFESAAKIFQQLYDMDPERFLSSLDSWNYSTYFYIPDAHTNIDELTIRIDKKFTEAQKSEFKPNMLGDWLQPLSEIHFTKGIRGDSANGDKNYIYIFSAVAALILVIACFNFMNLSTARAMKRAKEVGLRKVMGAFRHQLVKQFLGETLILVLVSLVLGVILLEIMIPVFNALVGQQLKVTYFGSGGFMWIFLVAGLFTGVIAGSYPAFYLSSFIPVKVLKGQSGPSGNAGLRKVLTIMQFSVATFLLIGTMVVYAQLNFIQNTKLGFDKESVIYFNPPTPVWNNIEVFRENLLTQSGIKSVSLSNGTPGMPSATWRYGFPGKNIAERSVNTQIIDYDYLTTYGLEIKEGRALSREYATDSLQGYLVNEAFVKELMIENPVGTPIQALDGHPPGQIVGVVKDYHYRSLHQRIEPLILRIDPGNMWCASIKFSGGNLKSNIATVEKEWKKLAPDYPFTYDFLDDTIEQQYKADLNTGVLLSAFAGLAILIACLGLLGLTAFMTEQRKKEIGVRKVLGASVLNIVVLLSRDFSKLVVIAFVAVMPLAWYGVHKWLEDFAYKVEINPILYIGAGVLLSLLAWISIAYQSIKAAVVNPTETLRNE
jgi:putative ABC transport system permease protein